MDIGSKIYLGNREWVILAKKDASALIISERVIGERAYNDEFSAGITWENCTLRAYLNGEFYDSIGEKDQKHIIETEIKNPDNLWYDISGGNDTRDKVFILSLEEADEYFGNSGDYLNKRGHKFNFSSDSYIASEDGTCYTNSHDEKRVGRDNEGYTSWWWLRTPGDDGSSASLIDSYGKGDVEGQYVNSSNGGIRPALWIHLKEEMGATMSKADIKAKEIIGKVNALAGLVEFKAYMNELEAKRPYMSKWGGRADFPVQHFLFSVDPGNGCSTAASLLHEYLKETELFGRAPGNNYKDYKMEEMKFLRYPEDSNYFMTSEYMKTLPDEIKAVAPGLLVFHIEDWLNHLETPVFTDMLNVCWEMRNQITFIFVIPYLDEGVLARVHARLEDVLNIRIMHFHPYNDEELTEAIVCHLNDFDIKMDNTAEPFIKHVLIEERGDRRFYGMQTVNRLATELVLMKARNASLKLNQAPPDTLTGDDFDKEEIVDDQKPAFEQLDELIGLTDVKRRIRELVASVQADKKFSESGSVPPCSHMVFTGSPGTGKTTVARIIGKIFRENGILRVGDLLEVNRFDLVGQFIGQTGPKTVERCRAALDSVMFIDEAYLLATDRGSRGADFGFEAIGALVAEMENYRDRLVVIMAGYDKEMEQLFDLNPGLRSRIPHKINFPNYTRDELFEIFKLQAGKKHAFDDSFLESAQEFLNGLTDEFIESKEFGNARFVRNLIERIRVKALLRLQGDILTQEGEKLLLLATDLESALIDEDMAGINKKDNRRRIGFFTDNSLQI